MLPDSFKASYQTKISKRKEVNALYNLVKNNSDPDLKILRNKTIFKDLKKLGEKRYTIRSEMKSKGVPVDACSPESLPPAPPESSSRGAGSKRKRSVAESSVSRKQQEAIRELEGLCSNVVCTEL